MRRRLPVTGVIWDLDGTLVRLSVALPAIAGWKQQICRQLSAYGWTGELSPLLPTLERALAVAEENGADEHLRGQVYGQLDDWELEALEGIDVVTPLADAMLTFNERSIPNAVVTNNGRCAVERALIHLRDWAARREVSAPAFTAVVCRSYHLAAKPSPDGMVQALDSLERAAGGPLDHLLVVGDMPSDAQAAEALRTETTAMVWMVKPQNGGWDWPEDVLTCGLPDDVLVRLGLRTG